MRTYSLTHEVDPAAPYNVAPPQRRIVAHPADSKGQYALVYVPGLGGDATAAFKPSTNGYNRYLFFHNLVSAGVPVISHDFTYPRTAPSGPIDEKGRAWGNKTFRDTVESIRTVLCPAHGWRSDKILMMGSSAGCASMLTYAQERPERVAGLILTLPGTTVEAIRSVEVLSGLGSGTTEATDTGLTNTVNNAWGVGYMSVGQKDTTGSKTGHPGWYYGTSIVYEGGSPRAGDPVEPTDPRNTAAIASIVNRGAPVHYYYSTGDTVVTFTDANGNLIAPGATSWCPAIGITAEIISTTDNHDGATQPPGRPPDAQWQDLPVSDIARALLTAP